MSHPDTSCATTPRNTSLFACLLVLFAYTARPAAQFPVTAPEGGVSLADSSFPSFDLPPDCQTSAFGNKAWAAVTIEFFGGSLSGEQVVKLGLKDASHGLGDYDLGAVKLQGSSGLKWFVKVQSPTLPDGFVARADLSGVVVLDGRLYVYGSGSAEAHAGITVSELLEGGRTRIVAAKSLADYEIRHSYDYSVGASIDLLGGDGVELPLGLNAGRGFSFETQRVRGDRIEFSTPVLLQIGAVYVIEFKLCGAAENRGLRAVHRSGVVFGKADGIGDGDFLGDDVEVGPTDPSHLFEAMDFFALDLPDLAIGKPFKGSAQFKFPALDGLFDGKVIDAFNDFSIAPLGEFKKVSEMYDVLGWSPLSLRDKLSKPSGPLDQPGGAYAGEFDGGAWFEQLQLQFAGL